MAALGANPESLKEAKWSFVTWRISHQSFSKNLLLGLFLRGRFPGDFEEGKGAHQGIRGTWPIEGRKLLIKEGKRASHANGLVLGPLPWWNMAPLERPIKRSMNLSHRHFLRAREMTT